MLEKNLAFLSYPSHRKLKSSIAVNKTEKLGRVENEWFSSCNSSCYTSPALGVGLIILLIWFFIERKGLAFYLGNGGILHLSPSSFLVFSDGHIDLSSHNFSLLFRSQILSLILVLKVHLKLLHKAFFSFTLEDLLHLLLLLRHGVDIMPYVWPTLATCIF